MTEDAILSVLATGARITSLGNLRRCLPGVPYASLRYHLARLKERGAIVRTGDAYALAAMPPATDVFVHVSALQEPEEFLVERDGAE